MGVLRHVTHAAPYRARPHARSQDCARTLAAIRPSSVRSPLRLGQPTRCPERL
jgi:hypothetical protein